MARSRRARAALAVLATTATIMSTAACLSEETPPQSQACDTSTPSNLYQQPVELTWWHNANVPAVDPVNNPGAKEYWSKVARQFEALHPTVTIKDEGYLSNDLQRQLIPAALQTNDPPDLFQAWGGGEILDQANKNQVKDITGAAAAEIQAIGATSDIWKSGECQYGLPYKFAIEGIWYNKKIFADNNLSVPKTRAELESVMSKLKSAGIAPFAVAAGDGWPAAHWWYQFAIHTCSTEQLANIVKEPGKLNFDDPCLVKAGEELEKFLDLDPFQPDFLGARFGADPSSAAVLLNGVAAMELMGDWNKGTIEGQSADGLGLGDDLGWFPVPPLVEGAGQVALGGGDGFACHKNAPAECVEFLKYLLSPEVQRGYAALGDGLPVIPAAFSAITDPVIQDILEASAASPSVQLWLDTQYGSTVGGPMNAAIVEIFDGSGTPQGVVDAMKTAAAR